MSTLMRLRMLAVMLVLCSMSLASLVNADGELKNQTSAEPKLKLGVYMESLCPDTRRFFLNQLVPTYRAIGQVIELKMVPFGHARTLANSRMICQHGPRECEGNRRMACIQARTSNQSEVVETFGCLFSMESSVKDCIEANIKGASADDIEKCTKDDESFKLMQTAERQTGRLDYVPHLTLNDQSSNEIQDEAEHNLKDFLCKQYKGPNPIEACKSSSL